MHFFAFLFLLLPLEVMAGWCYSIATNVDSTTPVSPLYEAQFYVANKCSQEEPYLFLQRSAFVGCYKKREDAEKVLQTSGFPFQDPKIVYHKVSITDTYVIFPNASYRSLSKTKRKLKNIYHSNSIKKISKKFPRRFYGEGIKLLKYEKITFVPTLFLYQLREQGFGTDGKVLLLYDGVYSLEMLYKKLHNDKYIKKVNADTYELRVPIIISSTASLVIKNKTLRLETRPKAMFILYFGDFYMKNSKVVTWDTKRNRYAKREKIPKNKLLYIDYEKPRPYFTGLSGSHTYFINNIFKGLGFHSGISTFGIGLLYAPGENMYYPANKAFNYFMSKNNNPEALYIGNDISDATMAFYTNGAKNTYYLGNYTHDNIIYNFDPHDYSKGLVIARNLSIRAQNAHGIIISREVDHSIIAENLSLKNHSAGIMIDRLSNHNVIYNNISILNGFMGISIQESQDNLITHNTVALNSINGMMIRNSLNISIEHNDIVKNGKNGIEISSKNIDNIPGRDFSIDPYFKACSAVLKKNQLLDNYNANIMVKNSSAVYMYANKNKAFKQVGGDLEFFYKDIFDKKGNFRLYGRGFPFRGINTETSKLNPYAFQAAKKIYIEIADEPNDFIGSDFGIAYLKNNKELYGFKQFQRASTNFTAGALTYLGYLYLIDSRENDFKDREKTIEGLMYLIEDIIMKNPHYIDFEKLLYFIPHSKNLIEEAFVRAKENMSDGRLFKKSAYKKSILCTNTLKKKYQVKSAIRYFVYKMNLIKSNSFLNYCHVSDKDYNIFTPLLISSIKQRLKKDNNLKKRIFRYQKKMIAAGFKNDLCAKSAKRHAYIKAQTAELAKMEDEKEIKKLMPKLKEQLKKINEFRIRKISMQQLLKILNEEGVKN